MSEQNTISLTPVPKGRLEILEAPLSSDSNFEKPLEFSLVIPSYNESKNIQEIIHNVSNLLDIVLANQYELIVVDDNSPDKIWQLAQELIPYFPQLRVMRRQKEKGLSTAVIRGWQVARGKVLGVIDADLQHPPEVLLRLWQEMERGADLATASRNIEGGGVSQWSIIRRFLSRGAQMLGLLILPEVVSRLSDPMSGYFMVRRDTVVGKSLSPVGYKILIEISARARIRWIAEVGYVFRKDKLERAK